MTPTAIYLLIALFGTLYYGLGAFAVWGDPGPMPHSHRWHQYWFNFAGVAVGWIAGWPVFNHWFLLDERPTFITLALLLVAFVGVTGHLPQILMLWGLVRRGNHSSARPVWPPERT